MRSATQKADIRAGSGMADGDGTSDAAPAPVTTVTFRWAASAGVLGQARHTM